MKKLNLQLNSDWKTFLKEEIKSDDFKKIISEIPWTLALYTKGLNNQWEKQSDFLRLAPPSNF